MSVSDLRMRLLSWLSNVLVWAMLLPLMLDYQYPPPLRRYLPIGLLVSVSAINIYLTVMHNRIRREKSREDREEYRQLAISRVTEAPETPSPAPPPPRARA